MDAFTHTIIATGCMMISYFVGRYMAKTSIFNSIVEATLDRLEEDGFIRAVINNKGEKEIVRIDDIINEALKKWGNYESWSS